MKAKNIKPLKELREIREKMSVRYWKNNETLKSDMKKIREKYKLKLNIELKSNKKVI